MERKRVSEGTHDLESEGTASEEMKSEQARGTYGLESSKAGSREDTERK
jgi:hypothetical protein